jgi:hypothetical protein
MRDEAIFRLGNKGLSIGIVQLDLVPKIAKVT